MGGGGGLSSSAERVHRELLGSSPVSLVVLCSQHFPQTVSLSSHDYLFHNLRMLQSLQFRLVKDENRKLSSALQTGRVLFHQSQRSVHENEVQTVGRKHLRIVGANTSVSRDYQTA